MFKLVSRKRFDELLMSEFVAEDRGRYIEELLSSVADLEDKIAQANDELLQLKTKYEKYENSTENSVTLKISQDMETITPIITHRDDAFESLFQIGMLSDAQSGNQFAIQLALMTVASEGLTQILDSFEEEIVDGGA